MRCREAMDRIGRGLDGSLPPDHARELERHLSGCPRCRAERLLQARMLEALRTPPPERLPADFTERAVRSVFTASPHRGRFSLGRDLVRALVFSAAAVSLLVVGPEVVRSCGALVSSAWPTAVEFAAFFAQGAGVFFESLDDLIRALDGPGATLLRSVLIALISAGVAVWGFREACGFLRE